jgi:CubicO group peptidase (beta-lactamase class C family)
VAAAGYLAVDAASHHRAPDSGLVAGYAALAKEQLFDPLGMKDATFEASDNDAAGQVHDAQGPWKIAPVEPETGGALRPALGLRASANDVAAWLQVEVSGGVGPDGKSFLPTDAVEERWRLPSGDDKRDYALGWATQHYRGIEIVTREGEHDNQTELVAIIPQYRTAFALLTNGSGKDTAVFLQDALLNLTDLLKETAAGP